MLDQKFPGHVRHQYGAQAIKKFECRSGTVAIKLVRVVTGEDKDRYPHIHGCESPASGLFNEDGYSERQEDGFRQVDWRECGDLPKVVGGEHHEDGDVEVQKGLLNGDAEECNDADRGRDEDDDRHMEVPPVQRSSKGRAVGCRAAS